MLEAASTRCCLLAPRVRVARSLSFTRSLGRFVINTVISVMLIVSVSIATHMYMAVSLNMLLSSAEKKSKLPLVTYLSSVVSEYVRALQR